MPRQSPDDSGYEHVYGKRVCPRCGQLVTTCAWGFVSHVKSCLRKVVVVNGKEHPAVPEEEIEERWK